jgi:hypothetical protein
MLHGPEGEALKALPEIFSEVFPEFVIEKKARPI